VPTIRDRRLDGFLGPGVAHNPAMESVRDAQPGIAHKTTPSARNNAPLTERVLDRLGRPRWLWIALWASTALIAPACLLGTLAVQGELSRVASVPGLLFAQMVIVYVAVVCLWGVGRLTRDARALAADLVRMTGTERPLESLGGVATLVPPIVLTAAIEVVNTTWTWERYGAAVALVVLPLLTLSILPIMTFVWTYVQLLVGLDRLGRGRLALDLFPQDRSLGLAPVGGLAFSGFVLVWAIVIPIFVTSQNTTTFAASVAIVPILVALFFLSMWRLHRQMSAAKARYVAETRELFAKAYEPIRTSGTLDALQAQAQLLGPAQALEERAERILEWPIDEGMTARIAIILTGIVTGLILRFIQIAANL
jgi:hypothetical protein